MASKALKNSIIFINVLFMALGAVLLGFGIWVLIDREGVVELSRMELDGSYTNLANPGLLETAAYMSVFEGAAMILLAILAFCGAAKESKCYLALYSGFVILLAILLIIIVVLTAVSEVLFDDYMRSGLKNAIRDEYDGILTSDNKFTRAFDSAQVEFECCGVDSYEEFKNITTVWVDKGALQVPKACCMIDKNLFFNNDQYEPVDENCAQSAFANLTNIEKPCYDSIRDWMHEKNLLMLGVAAAVAVIQIISVLLAICYMRTIGKLYG